METRYDDEVEYWRGVFKALKAGTETEETVARYRRLLDSESELDPHIAAELPAMSGAEPLKVLDVGCGPLTVLGKKAGRQRLSVVGVDPLADQYKAMLKEIDFVQPFECRSGFGEEVDRYFPHNHFDFVFSRNALDHSQHPDQAIRAMIRVAKPGAPIWVNVNRNEGINASYNGLHSWNFEVLYDTIAVWNPSKVNVLESIVDGLPFKWSMTDIDKKKTCPQEIDIVIYKDGIDMTQMEPCGPGVFASFTGRGKFITVWAPTDLDERYNLFIHGYASKGRMSFNQSIRWYNTRRRRSIPIPPDAEISHVQLGQFDVQFENGRSRYENIWVGRLERSVSADSIKSDN